MVKTKEGKLPWTDILPKQSIIMCSFKLDESHKLLENTRKFLKRWYRDHEDVVQN